MRRGERARFARRGWRCIDRGRRCPAPPAALSAAAVAATKIEKVKDNLFIITGSGTANREAFSGGNTAVFITNAGVVIVDTKLAGWGQVILDRVRSVTDKPITTIINTHTHGDHTGSNAFRHLGRDDRPGEHGGEHGPDGRFQGRQGSSSEADVQRQNVDRRRQRSDRPVLFGRGHTDGDTFVVFPALGRCTWAIFSLEVRAVSGSQQRRERRGHPKTLDSALKGIRNVDTIVGGHQPVVQWKDLQEYQRFNADLLAAVQAAMKAGKSVDEAAASINLTTKYAGYESARTKAAIQAIYDELGKK